MSNAERIRYLDARLNWFFAAWFAALVLAASVLAGWLIVEWIGG